MEHSLKATGMAHEMPQIRAYADSDHVFIAWRPDAPIPGRIRICRLQFR